MKLTKIDKNRLGAFVAFPRTRLAGLPPTPPDDLRADEFAARVVDTPENGKAWLVEQQAGPRMVFQVFRAENPADFDRQLNILLSMHESPIYVSGHLDALLLFQGNHDHMDITQANHMEVVARINQTRDRAAYWWQLYGRHQADHG